MQKRLMSIGCAVTFLIYGCSNSGLNPAEMEKNSILLDVRTVSEYQQGHIKGAVNLPLDDIDTGAGQIIPDKNMRIYIYCRSGRRSKKAMSKLLQQGYNNITDFGSMADAEKSLIIP